MGNDREELITIIVPVYNVEKYIEKCAMSLLGQTYKKCEFIFVNDGSEDDSVEILEKIKDKRIRIVNQKNMGVSSARNVGLDMANGEYVMFIDADDYAAADCVSYLYSLIKDNDADFAYSTKVFKTRMDKQVNASDVRIVDGDESCGILLSPDVVVGAWNKIYKRSVIEKSKLRFRTDLYYGEGLDFIIRMSLASKKVAVGDKKIIYYRKNNFSSATTKYDINKYHNGLKSLKRIQKLVDVKNGFVNAMFKLHESSFYLGAITQMIENNETQIYKHDYKKWKKHLRDNVVFIVKSTYVSGYRKCLICVGAYFPHLAAALDRRRRKRIIRNSVD